MTINTVSIEECVKLNLSPDEYLYMRLLVDGDAVNMSALRTIKTYRPNMALLIEKGWIIKEGDEPVRSTGKFEQATAVGYDSSFIELCNAYPDSTPSGRKLKMNLNSIKKNYVDILKKSGSKTYHEHILKCLALENESRNRKDSSGKDAREYYLSLSNWVLKQAWKTYEKDLENMGVYVEHKTELL